MPFAIPEFYLHSRSGSGNLNLSYGANFAYLDSLSGFNPQRYALMFDYTPSEFSRFRMQVQQSKLLPDVTDNQVFLQYILTLGAHGGHKY